MFHVSAENYRAISIAIFNFIHPSIRPFISYPSIRSSIHPIHPYRQSIFGIQILLPPPEQYFAA